MSSSACYEMLQPIYVESNILIK